MTISPSTATTRVGTTHPIANPNGSAGFTATTGPDGESIPVVPPKEAESGVDYYMNLQAIQNLLGE